MLLASKGVAVSHTYRLTARVLNLPFPVPQGLAHLQHHMAGNCNTGV